ncbi:20181_t:CDS:2 [Gigaspora margarita]|uniref:20181_t:CDS:1 n=1 Tax=Gigaspora margarita TaxID=4874 RepID=A0ABN7V2M5_GIGMA|nr:20181_t:CDS:2 [Gigaspora margarita]
MAYIQINNFEQIIQINATNSNEACIEEIISNVEFDDIDNNIEQFEEESIMQTIANFDNFNTNDQITYNKTMIESSIQAIIIIM